MFKKLLMGCLLIMTSACATVSEPRFVKVNFVAKDARTGQQLPGTACNITMKSTMVHSGMTPFATELDARTPGYEVVCDAAGYKTTTKLLPRIGTESFDKTMSNSVTFVGAVADLATKSDETYVSNVTILMEHKND